MWRPARNRYSAPWSKPGSPNSRGGRGIIGAHLCLADADASAVQTAEKKSRAHRALTPNWVLLVEGGGERAMLEAAGAELLPTALLAGAGAVGPVTGLYQLQFQAA